MTVAKDSAVVIKFMALFQKPRITISALSESGMRLSFTPKPSPSRCGQPGRFSQPTF
jgi:hypothetical protein